MARKCDITGKGTKTGNNVSHSHRKTRRQFKANVQKKRIYLEDEKRWVSVNLSTRAIRTIQKIGLKSLLKKHPEANIR
ncbi:MAG: 50S ribosomal protein L28 [Spirochaetia bacterium]|nr:50S ribosomal protein L28 [Spirochaetia bacterium]